MSCTKVRYFTRKEAKKAMKIANRHFHIELTNTYYCSICAGFHLTSMKKKEYRIKRKHVTFPLNEDPQLIQLREAAMRNMCKPKR